MKKNSLILAENEAYSLDCYETQLNNNVLVVGTSGAGKTRSIVTPNLLQATGSYIVSDPKGNLYGKYKDYLESKGYVVKKLDFTDPKNSSHYNFFRYIKSDQDIVKVAHMLTYQNGGSIGDDPFWDRAAQLLIQAVMAYLWECWTIKEQNLKRILQLIESAQVDGDFEDRKSVLDNVFNEYERRNKDSFAVRCYKRFRVAANRTLRSILITVHSTLSLYDTPEIGELMADDDIDIQSIGKKKTALFVVVSDTDRSLDGLVNVFFTQAMNELCYYADKKCKNNTLPVPVRFILDDFATNCKIDEFPRMIASIRSRGISTMLMIQAESQLTNCYGYDGRTIIGNCDTYMYLGGNDLETAKAVAERCDVPLKKILNMPVGTNWLFRRGQEPKHCRNFNIDNMLLELEKSMKYDSRIA